MTRYRHIIRLLSLAMALLYATATSAQLQTTMVNGDTIHINACQTTSGIIYDDGGPDGYYSNNFLGWIKLEGTPGATITLSGSYITESSSYDWINIWDGDDQIVYRYGGTGSLNVTSVNGSLTLEFRTDMSVTRSGFAFTWTSDGGSDVCTNVVNGLTATAVTDTTVAISWTSTNTAGPFFVYANGRKHTVNALSFVVDSLSPNKLYNIRVVDSTDDSNFCCADNIRVRTECGLVRFPYDEGFEDYKVDSFPMCWLRQMNFDDPNYIPRIDGAHSWSGNRSLMLSCGGNYTADHFGMVASAPFAGTGERTTHLHLMASHNYTSVVVGVCDSTGSEYNSYGFTPVTTLYLTTSWASYRVDWTATAPGQRLALRMEQGMQSYSGCFVYIDDIGVEGCGVDSLVTSHIDYDRLTLSWSTFNDPTCLLIIHDNTDDTYDTIENVVSPLAITDLLATHTYTFSIWPSCDGHSSVGRNITVTMPAMPTDANMYCSPFRESGSIPYGWSTYLTAGYFNYNSSRGAVYWYSSNSYYSNPSFLISDRMINLAGKHVLVQFSANSPGQILLGTMEYADDVSTFTQLATKNIEYNYITGTYNYDDLEYTACFDIPDSSTARHLAIGFTGNSYSYYYITAIEIGDSADLMGDQRRIHRRGSTVELQWDTIHDTVFVEHGIRAFTPGTGTVDTFYNTQRGTIEGLSFSTQYDFYIHLPGWHPCRDRVIEETTATADYPMPWCEDFSSLFSSAWNSSTGDWMRWNTLNSTPLFSYHPNNALGRTLEFASWGTSGYHSSAILPDIETDSAEWLSFYISDKAPTSTIQVYGITAYTLGSRSGAHQITDIANISINASSGRRHYVLHLDSAQTHDRRLILQYEHSYPYLFYRSYIDELQVAHSAYGEIAPIYVGYDSAAFYIDTIYGTDSVEVTLLSQTDTHTVSVSLADIDTICFDSLQPSTQYSVLVRPFGGGCPSFAQYIITRSDPTGEGGGSGGGSSYADCFTMDDVLSDELPIHWASEGTHAVTLADELQFQAGTALVTHPSQWLAGLTLSFRARSASTGDTLKLGIYPADSISTDSTHFTLVDSLFSVTDTMLTDTTWNHFALKIHNVPTGKWRLCFQAGTGDVFIDDIGISSCPMVYFETDGDAIVCTMDGFSGSYYLTIDDSAGTDHRVLQIDENPFRVIGTKLNSKYTLAWSRNGSQSCMPQTTLRTDSALTLPYCVYFNQSYSDVAMPSTWSVAKGNTWDTLQPSSMPALYMSPSSSTHWFYAILPTFLTDSALSVYVNAYWNNYTLDSNQFQIGVLANGTDTASFIPIYSNPYFSGSYGHNINASADMSSYADKRIALRTRKSIYLYSVRVYSLPVPEYSLPHAGMLKVTSSVAKPYWIEVSSPHSIIPITTSPQILNIGTGSRNIRQVGDSLGTTCENYTSYNLRSTMTIPYCGGGFHVYRNSWYLMNELQVDSTTGVTLSITTSNASLNDTVFVGMLTDALDMSSYTAIDTIIENGTKYVDLSSYSDTGRWIGLYGAPTNNSSIYISNLMIENCPGVISATARLKRWNQVEIDAHTAPFFVEYYPTNIYSYQGNPSNTRVQIDSVPYTLTLDPETQYRFYFHCDSLNTSCRSSYDIKTLAAPIEVPSCIDFDTFAVGVMPSSWDRRASNISVSSTHTHSGTRSLSIPIGNNSYVITPDVNIDSIKRVTMSIWYYTEDPSDRLVVGVIKDPYDMNTYHPIRTLAPGVAGTWQRGMVEFSNAPDGANFLVFQSKSNHQPEGRSIYIDDIYIDTSIAYGLTVKDISSASITLDWNHIGNPDVTVTVKDGDEIDTVFTHATPPLLIDPISMLHYYTFIFNSICGNDDGYCNTNIVDSFSVITPAPGVGCINATDLNSPQTVFFSGDYNNPYLQAGAVNYGSTHPDSRHTVCYDTAARDPRTGNLLRTIPEGYTSSVRLGNWSTNVFDPEAEGIIYSLFVDTGSFELLLLRYAAVLQDPMHAQADQPRFRMELLDSNFNLIDPSCTSADFIADQSLGWHTAPNGVLWKDWTSVGIDLTAHAGEQVYFRLTTYDCNEGNHYGYAYFTLECMRKNMNTESCGDVATNTLRAPEGFHYRWYTSESTATVSTNQSITVPSQDITYFCDVSKVDNDACFFTISAYGGTRYPIADFDTNVSFIDFQFHVAFTNTSSISNDNINPLPGSSCETAYWTFGNGNASSSYHGSAVYPDTGTYMVRLVSGIASNQCQDTATMMMKLVWPDNVFVLDSLVCEDQMPLMWNDSVFTTSESKFSLLQAHNGSDSIILMRVHVVEVPTVLASTDTTIFRGDTALLTATSNFPVTWYDTLGNIIGSGNNVNVSPERSSHFMASSFNTGFNIVYNGNFELGNTGFNSGYIFKTYPTNQALQEGDYDICTDAKNTHGAFSSCSDHTSSLGNYMVINGSTVPNTTVWSQTVTVEPNTEYAFSAWVSNVTSSGLENEVAYLQFMINGNQVGPIFSCPNVLAQWAKYYEVWNSGSNTSATISIVNQNTVGGGNDFGIDDISLAPTMCHVYDTVDVTVIQHIDTFVCENYLPINWQGHTFANDSVTWDTLTATNGMDSIIRSELHVKHNTSSTVYDTVIENNLPHTFFEAVFDTNIADSIVIGVNAASCDSIVSYNLHVHWNVAVSVDSTVCLINMPIMWNNTLFDTTLTTTATMVRQVTLSTWGGADSVVTMNVTVVPNPLGTYYDTVVQNQLPYNYRGHVFDTIINDSTLIFAGSQLCDSIISYNLHVWYNQDTTLYMYICDDAMPYTWNTHTFTTADSTENAGINYVLYKTVIIPTIHGADSTMYLELTVKPTYDTVDTIVICPGYPYLYRNVDYGGPASFDTILLTRQDCDSTVHVVLQPRDPSYHIYPLYSFDSTSWSSIDSAIIGCTPDTLFLKDTTGGTPSYKWTYVSADTIFTTTYSNLSIAYLNGSDSLTALTSVIITDIYGCHDTMAWPILMFQSPKAEFEWAPTNPPMHNPEAAFINLTYQPDTLRYLWNIQKAVGGAYDTSTLFAPFYHWGAEGENMAGDYRVVLTAYWDHSIDTMLYGDWFNDSLATPFHYLLPSLHYPITHTCIDSTDNIVTITNEYLQFPNLVTPNGDDNNDIWKVVNLIEFGNYSMNELWIYDRWGVLVYHVKNITTEEQFWDPNSTNSPDGTYYYRFLARSLYGSVKRNGLIEVLRD